MQHPFLHLPPETISIIRNDIALAEQQGRLSDAQMELVNSRKWLHLFVPAQYGGLDLPLPEAVRLEESIAYADGSLGWVVTLCAGAAMFVGYFHDELAEQVFNTPSVCLAGSGQPGGVAKVHANGFVVNGSWPYCSGAPHATHFTANCVIEGTGYVRSFVFKKEEVALHANWPYMGLNATGGFGYSVNNLFVPAVRAFDILPETARLPNPVYQYPFLQLAEATIAANISGMCCYFVDLAEKHLRNKLEAHTVSEAVKRKGIGLADKVRQNIASLRERFYNSLDASWAAHLGGGGITAHLCSEVSHASIAMASQSRLLVGELYPYCGLEAARTSTLINQVWRNIHTASQHSLLLER